MYFHVWFVTKYRKPVLSSTVEEKLLAIIEEIREKKRYRILKIGTCKDHVHILLELDRKEELPAAVRTLKAVSAKKILEETPHLRTADIRHLWAKRYGSREIAEQEIEDIVEYICNQKKIPHS